MQASSAVSTAKANGQSPASVDVPELEELARRVDEATKTVRGLADEDARDAADELKRAVEAFHKAGLVTIVRALKADPRGMELLRDLARDPTVFSLFTMHGIVKPDIRAQVTQVLEYVRPYMQSHGGDVELAYVEGETAYVRLHGACNGCSMSSVTLRDGVTEALVENVAGIARVEVVPNEPQSGFVPLEAVGVSKAGWVQGPMADAVEPGRPVAVDLGGVPTVLVRVGDALHAYRNACAHQGLPLDGGMLDSDGVLTCPWHGFKYDASTGECFSAPEAQLEAFPLRVKEGRIWVRPPRA
jgi:nitrite reductase/ring-hydroxylating ferredoxin subunit/Fe-S cluster biogenesis protein NfuA